MWAKFFLFFFAFEVYVNWLIVSIGQFYDTTLLLACTGGPR